MESRDPIGSCPTSILNPVPDPLQHHGTEHGVLETFPRLTLNEETLRAAAARSHGGAVKPERRRRPRHARYRTQPVTFTEILEVDEPTAPDQNEAAPSGVDLDQIKNELAAFSRTMQETGSLPSMARPGSAHGP